MKRHIVASGATALALCLGAGQALAADLVLPVELAVPIQPPTAEQNTLLHLLAQLLGGGDPQPGVSATAGAVHATSTGGEGIVQEQGLPTTVAVADSWVSNIDQPVGLAGGVDAAGRGAVHQARTSQATAAAANDHTQQSSEAAGQGGSEAAQASVTHQGVPVAIGAAISAPVNLNAPIGVLAARIAGDVTQVGDALADAAAVDNSIGQPVEGGGGEGLHAQLSDSRQTVPVTLGLALSAPLNVNLPIDILSAGLGGSSDYTDLADLLRGILSIGPEPGAAGGEVRQASTSEATAVASNNVVEQSAATGGGEASQAAEAHQFVPAAVAAALSLPVNGNLPIGVLQTPAAGPGADVNQESGAETRAAALNFHAEQKATSEGGGTNTSTQSSDNDQVLPIAIATDLAVPINLNLPVTLLGQHLDGTGPVDLSVVQRTLDAVDATIADPLGTLKAVLEDPAGTIDYLLRG